MPRDSSGNYTLPAGNPVITGTTITSDWANATMPDLGNEITNSLSRDGQGGMLAPLPFVDGSQSQPAMTFNLEPNLGWFREGDALMSLAALGNVHLQYDATGTNLVMSQGVNPRFTFSPSDVGGGGVLAWLNAGLNLLGVIAVDEATGEMLLSRFDGAGGGGGSVLLTAFTLEDDGNVSVDGPEPTQDQNLTRKDYVDANFARYLQGYEADVGVHEDFAGDLDTIDFNSVYSFESANTTNNPVDIGTTAIICTDNWSASPAFSVQRIYQIDPTTYKMWMRTEDNSVWSAWVLVADGSQLDFSNGQMVTNLPTSDPGVPGALWNNAGVVNVSP